MQAVGNTFIKLSSITLLAFSVSLTGCQTFKNLTGGEDADDAVETAEKSEQNYYSDAVAKIDEGRYVQAIEDLTNLRTFYPTGQYSEQALLDVMYAQYESGQFAVAASSAEQFISLYPSNPQISYAHYVRGVSNMQGSSEGFSLNLFNLNQAERDTAYLRIAFNNFQELINKYPNSPYAPDAAQRMIYIYNQFAESELSAADWYIEREAYVAAVNRAKWAFQYYPLSESTPKAIAILAYSHDQLGLTDLATEYKTLLQINYPSWLTNDGRVRLDTKRDRSWLNKLTFGQLGRSGVEGSPLNTGDYNGATKTQVVRSARQMSLPNANTATANSAQGTAPTNGASNLNFGLGLPENSTAPQNQSSTSPMAREATEATIDPKIINTTPTTTPTE
ncbi:outer membrane protein assembly factor BamD [Psychrobacter sp.]|uniref:outer membrane protein assembly factor BamD n=1 Tax=Psychrobacter sp. TaxID=56811 RepID=UPI002647A4C3|nr:outer membrane protein assembly factor BamD [Psychrobacter sp.]MDN6276351.1 outer membrane protein assembly factor BamD [Psychrobacter sp.]MDN6308538.1 outer membrane protein assembly factor BamD [Psychrobacter sp.]